MNIGCCLRQMLGSSHEVRSDSESDLSWESSAESGHVLHSGFSSWQAAEHAHQAVFGILGSKRQLDPDWSRARLSKESPTRGYAKLCPSRERRYAAIVDQARNILAIQTIET
jgi:hypothetical protein